MPSHRAQPRRPHDERDAFFRDLRALRAQRGLDLSEIAERTRFPLDMLAAAETGPELPSLPALSAYLRGCGEPLNGWEDRWRRLASGTVPADDGLPVRDAGTSPLASAGAAVAWTHVPARPAYVIKRLGHRRTRRRPVAFRRNATVAAGAAVALLAGGGAALLAANQAPGHRAPAIAASPAPTSPVRAGLAPAPRKHPRAPGTPCSQECLDVAGVGCPQDQDDDVIVSNAPTGPGWATAGGGWTGIDCGDSAVWTMNPNGNQPVSSTLTWKFSLVPAVSQCTLAVFVPTQDALGTADYAIFTGNPAEPRNIAVIPVRQAASAGQWVTLGRYPASGTSVEIRVSPATGSAGAPGPGAHGRNHVTGVAPGHRAAIAASAASARCG